MKPIGSIVTAITGSPAPVLFVDSCTLLDVVRAPLRDKPGEVRVAREILAAVRKVPKTAHLLIASPTSKEWADHIAEAVADCTTAVNGCNAVSLICGHMALPAVASLPAAVLDLPNLLRGLSKDLLNESVEIKNQAAAMDKAIARIIASIHPAKPGGKGAKDSIILEHAIETTGKLRGKGFPQPCVFISSNTNDFGVRGSTTLHPLLAPVFTPVNLQYAVSLTHAESILTAAGWVP
jgi:hypothetical protein